MPRPHLRVRIGFNSNPDDAAQDWTDVSEYVRLADGLDLSRGRADEFSSVEPGRASLVLKNDDGRFTFGNGASPYYPGVVPMKRIRIDASPDGGQTWFPRFDGHVDGWPVSWLSPLATQSVITITASDRLSRFGAKRQLMDPLAEELGTSSGQDSGWTLGSLLPYEGAPAWTDPADDPGYPAESLYPAEDLYPTEA